MSTAAPERMFSLRVFAVAAGLKLRYVRGLCDSGDIRTWRHGGQRQRKRFIPLDEVDRLAAEGWLIDYDLLMD